MISELLTDDPLRYHRRLPWKYDLDKHFERDMGKFKDEGILHEIFVANGLFVNNGYSIRHDYKAAVESVYKAEIKSLDFSGQSTEAANFINNWVDEKTKGKIKEILKEALSTETRVILVNALYFKALWLKPFPEGPCCIRNFYPDGPNGPSTKVKLMANFGDFPYHKDSECSVEVLGFPYQKGISTMYVFLPSNDSSRSKLKQAQKCLTADKIEDIIEKMREVVATILFPKIHLSGSFNLKDYLKRLGLDTIFNPRTSDFSMISDGSSANRGAVDNDRIYFENPYANEVDPLQKIDKARINGGLQNPGLFADDVIHKVDLEINERGTEAAAGKLATINVCLI